MQNRRSLPTRGPRPLRQGSSCWHDRAAQLTDPRGSRPTYDRVLKPLSSRFGTDSLRRRSVPRKLSSVHFTSTRWALEHVVYKYKVGSAIEGGNMEGLGHSLWEKGPRLVLPEVHLLVCMSTAAASTHPPSFRGNALTSAASHIHCLLCASQPNCSASRSASLAPCARGHNATWLALGTIRRKDRRLIYPDPALLAQCSPQAPAATLSMTALPCCRSVQYHPGRYRRKIPEHGSP